MVLSRRGNSSTLPAAMLFHKSRCLYSKIERFFFPGRSFRLSSSASVPTGESVGSRTLHVAAMRSTTHEKAAPSTHSSPRQQRPHRSHLAWRGCSLAGHEPCTSGNRRSRRELQRENRLRSCTRERSRTKGDEDADQWQVDPGGHSLSLTVSSELVAHARSRPRLARVISGRGRAGEGIRCVGRLCFKRFTLNVYPGQRVC
eukprot:COSAG04_NODE_67_length_29431_cov_17.894313_13_plen_201_part_00